MMSLANLAKPRWINVPCKIEILSDVFCFTEKTITRVDEKALQNNLEAFDKTCILNDSTCYIFLPHITDGDSFQSKPNYLDSVPYKGEAKDFQFLFETAEALFPPLFTYNMKYTTTYSKYGNIYHYQRHEIGADSLEGLYITFKGSTMLHTDIYLFMCHEGTYISYADVCNGHTDCTEHDKSDEEDCTCNKTTNYSKKYKFLGEDKSRGKCSDFYFSTQNNACQVFLDKAVFELGRKITSKIKMLGHNKGAQRNQLSCQTGKHKAYRVEQICIFRLEKDILIPCSQGEHLQMCKTFECNHMFKCPEFYCIPWSYVCDGKWDCPHGMDESIDLSQSGVKCKNMYKCRKSQICIHLHDVGDNTPDCPFGDDESITLLKNVTCPNVCECLTFVLKCTNNSARIALQKAKPFCVVFLQYCHVKGFHFSMAVPVSVFWSIVNTDLVTVCSDLSGLKFLRRIQATFNSIAEIESDCFMSSVNLSAIDLSNNVLSRIWLHSFSTLQFLLVLNFSNNLLQQLPEQFLHDDVNLHIISLINNSLNKQGSYTLKNIEINIIQTKDYRTCCKMLCEAKCTASRPWYVACTDFLPTNGIRLAFYFICTAVATVTMACILSQIIFIKINKNHESCFEVTVHFLNTTDFTCAINLFVLSLADLYFHGSFALLENKWRSHFMCFTVFGMNLFHGLNSPFLLTCLSFSRLMVVMFPVDSGFKIMKTVVRYNVCLFVTNLLLSGVLSVFTWANNYTLPFNVCSPFVDPTKEMTSLTVITWFTVLSQLGATIVICSLYTALFVHLKASQESFNNMKTTKQSSLNLIVHLLVITSSNIACWVPSGVVYLISSHSEEFSIDLVIWISVVVTPINSIINPVVFFACTMKKMKKRAKFSLDKPT